jgi:hypothetical protein
VRDALPTEIHAETDRTGGFGANPP